MHIYWSCSLQPVETSESPIDTEAKQVVEALPNALQEIYDGLSALPKTTILDVI